MKHNHVAKYSWKVNKPKIELDKKKEQALQYTQAEKELDMSEVTEEADDETS